MYPLTESVQLCSPDMKPETAGVVCLSTFLHQSLLPLLTGSENPQALPPLQAVVQWSPAPTKRG
jgi:hypothetical protein